MLPACLPVLCCIVPASNNANAVSNKEAITPFAYKNVKTLELGMGEARFLISG